MQSAKNLRPLAVGLLLALGAPSTAHASSSFDVDTGTLTMPKSAVRAYGFESASELVGLEVGTWGGGGNGLPTLSFKKIAAPADAQALINKGTDSNDAIEGTHAMSLSVSNGLVIRDAALWKSLAGGRFVASLWARADGGAPIFQIIYDNDPANVYGASGSTFATVRAIRTGRATSDGWAEYSTGPLDGAVWGVPVAGLIVMPSSRAKAGQSFLVDALTIEQATGKPVAPAVCRQENVDAACGPEGDCMFGHCISSAVTWGVNPSGAHREEMAKRWIHLSSHLIGDRNAAEQSAQMAPGLLQTARTALSSRQFLGEMNHFVNLLRDNHTSLGSPSNFTNFAPQVSFGTSSTLGGCFGLVDRDLVGGGLAYAVYQATANPLSGVPLKRGDLLIAVDGMDPKAFVDMAYPRWATTLPNDPGSDWGWSATVLSSLITRRASRATFLRCESSTLCDEAHRQTFTVDVASAIYPELLGQSMTKNVSPLVGCTPRFSESATENDAGGAAANEDPIYIAQGPDGQTWVEFDGFEGSTVWPMQMQTIFGKGPAAVLMDARNGHGGLLNLLQTLFDQFRDASEPIGFVSFGRAAWDKAETPDMYTRLQTCTLTDTNNLCFLGGADGVFPKPTAPGKSTKIAWLNTTDVSANDFAPRMLKGRTNTRIFAPHVTSGAFGAITSLPSLLSGWNGASMQIQDSKFAADVNGIATARWESSHGVEPDEVCVQKLSDAIAGTDTMLARASQWLSTP
jgi:hypothetical protein